VPMNGRRQVFVRPLVVVASVLVLLGVTATPAVAHGGESSSAEELVLTAIAVLEVHPVPGAAVDDKIRDAQDAKDRSGVKMDLVRQAGGALVRGDVAATKRLLEQSVGACPDSDILYVNDQSEKPPCVAPTQALALARHSVGGTSEVVLLIVAGAFALAGFAIIRQPRLRVHRAGGVR
jgi:hypothetical protein